MKRVDVFDLSAYGEDGLLPIGWLLWLVILFLSRHLLLLMVGAVSSIVGAGHGLEVIYSSPQFLFASLPAVVVLAAGLRRGPKAGALAVKLWSAGRWSLFASALIDLVLLAEGLFSNRFALNEYRALWGLCDVYVLLFLLRSRRLPAVFANRTFPGFGNIDSRGEVL